MGKTPGKVGTSIPGRLGTGEWGTKEDFENEAREVFLREIQDCAPIVIKQLLKRVWPEFAAAREAWKRKQGITDRSIGFPWPDKVRQAIHDWAGTHHLLNGNNVPGWLLRQVDATFWMWERHPSLRRNNQLSWSGIYTGYLVVDNLRDEELTITLPAYRWHPRRAYGSRESTERFILESLKSALKKRMDEIEALARRRGFCRTPEVRQGDHFNWAVRFQVLGERVTDIASSIRSADGNERTVNSGIEKILSRVGLSRRKEKPGPRPRRVSSGN
jgi:hypothetical protein